MDNYDYKTVAAPRRVKKRKGLKGLDALLAYEIEEIIQQEAALGWSYLRADSFPVEEPGGIFSAARMTERSVLIFRRLRAAPAADMAPAMQPAAPPPAPAPVADPYAAPPPTYAPTADPAAGAPPVPLQEPRPITPLRNNDET